MGNKTEKIIKRGMSFTTTLVMIFAVLKFMGLTTMSWVWVLSPWWLSFVVGLTAMAIVTLLIVLLAKK